MRASYILMKLIMMMIMMFAFWNRSPLFVGIMMRASYILIMMMMMMMPALNYSNTHPCLELAL